MIINLRTGVPVWYVVTSLNIYVYEVHGDVETSRIEADMLFVGVVDVPGKRISS